MAIKKIIKNVSFILFLIALLEGGGYLYGLQPSDIFYYHISYDKEKIKIEEDFNLKFEDKITEKNYPVLWEKNGRDNYRTTNVSNKYEHSRFFDTIIEEFKKIPKKILRKNINKIYGLDLIELNGLSAGGTFSSLEKEIFISLRTNSGKIIPRRFIKKTLHHELSSIFIKSYNFEEKKWRNAFDEDFLYKNEENPFYYLIYMQGDADIVSDEELYSRGLLKQYAETGLENDFNTYAEVIFTEPRKVKKLIAEYPVIKRKYEVFKSFYLDIDADFSPVFDKIDG